MGWFERDGQENTKNGDKGIWHPVMAGVNEPETSIKMVYARQAEYRIRELLQKQWSLCFPSKSKD